MKLSIVIPFHDEEENVVPVLNEIRRCHPEAEIIAVDDHSTDRTSEILGGQSGVRLCRLPRRLGQSAAVYGGLVRATGDVCVIMDGDGQSSAADIKRLLEFFPEYDLVIGCRVERCDSMARVVVSRIANRLRRGFTRDGVTDSGGTPKAMKRECVEHLIPFDGLHRFIPALLSRAGFRVIEVPVSHRRRLHGRTKYGTWGRAWRGVWDLLGVSWLLRRRIDPRIVGADAGAPDRQSPSP